MQTVTVTVTDPDEPLNVPVPGAEFGPVTEVKITVTIITKDGDEQPLAPIKVVIKGCLEGM